MILDTVQLSRPMYSLGHTPNQQDMLKAVMSMC